MEPPEKKTWRRRCKETFRTRHNEEHSAVFAGYALPFPCAGIGRAPVFGENAMRVCHRINGMGRGGSVFRTRHSGR